MPTRTDIENCLLILKAARKSFAPLEMKTGSISSSSNPKRSRNFEGKKRIHQELLLF